MLEQGVASAADIDRAIKLGLNHPMGPFEMADLVGLDVRLMILEHLHATLGETFRPAVITSYSIHYTKLYDHSQAPWPGGTGRHGLSRHGS